MQLRDLFNELPWDKGSITPLELQRLLNSDLNVHQDWRRAEGLLLDACAQLPQRLEPHIALYKMCAYRHRMGEARRHVDHVLDEAARQGDFAADWRSLAADPRPWLDAAGPRRLYLYSLKALGLVLRREGEIAATPVVLRKLSALDPDDQVGGSVVLEMAERVSEEEEEGLAS